MGKRLSEDDISYDNENFWWFMLAYMQGGDDEKELNLDEALREAVGKPNGPEGFNEWYAQFCPANNQDEEGIMKSPNEISGTLTDKLSYVIEFHAAEIRYFINDIYIGNTGGEFEAWFFTWSELQAFDRWSYLFLLMLPMVGVEERQRAEAQQVIAGHLQKVSVFTQCADYAAKCMLNGLVMQPAKGQTPEKENAGEQAVFSHKAGIGLVNNGIHSVRNVDLYPRYLDDVKAVNSALNELQNYSGPSYSAINESGSIVYYKTENGEERIISREEAPEFIVDKMESAVNRGQKESTRQNDYPNHKKGRRILTYMSIPFFAFGIFFLYKIFINKSYTFDNISGAIACGAGVLSLYFFELMLWIDESIARRRKKRAEEMKIPDVFIIKGRWSKRIVFVINLCALIICAVFLGGAVMAFLEKDYRIGLLFCFLMLLFFVFMTWPSCISYLKNVKLNLHISGKTIMLYRGNDEIEILSAAAAVCTFSCYGEVGPYPRAFLFNADGSLHATIFLDLPEYHLLKKYLIQQGASVTDQYNHF